ncbi:MAG TPA: rhamnulokinase family protein [Fimbriimonadaceae bacterium]
MKCLAIDIGAESGRGIEGWIEGGKLQIREVARFPNSPVSVDGTLRWDIEALASHVFSCVAAATDGLTSVGVDTWAIDYVLLDYRGQLIELPYNYRDARTDGMMAEVFKIIPRREIYEETGIQFLPFNTLFQLYAAKSMNSIDSKPLPEGETGPTEQRWAGSQTPCPSRVEGPVSPRTGGGPEESSLESLPLNCANCFLTIPDYLNFLLLAGNRLPCCEFTNATTTQFLSWKTGKWAKDLLRKLEIPTNIFPDLVPPGTVLGSMSSGVKVIAPACHDTGSAVAAVPAIGDGFAWVSSGTWSVMGIEVPSAVVTDASYEGNFTNEGGVGGTYRLSKNVMGLWLLQQCRATWAEAGHEYSYDELASLAAKATGVVFDPDSADFLKPGDMSSRIVSRIGGKPDDVGFIVRSILESLADKYRIVLSQLEELVGRPINRIHIIGGGSQNHLLNQLTANACRRRVVAGPVEATAIGNLMMQMVALGEIGTIVEGREMIMRTFPVEVFEPNSG